MKFKSFCFKSFVIFSLLGLWSVQGKDAEAIAQCDRADALYQVGAPVHFSLQAIKKEGAEEPAGWYWYMRKDSMTLMDSGKVTLDGKTQITGKLDEPGFLLFTAIKDTKKRETVRAGAGIDPLKIKPSLPPPADFDEFWQEQLKRLAAIPKNFKLTPLAPKPDLEAFDLQADSLGAPVSGYFVRPKGAKPKSLPAILTVMWAGVFDSRLSLATDWAKKGMLALDINAHGLPNGQPAAYYKAQAAGELNGYQIRGREKRETVYFLGMFLRLVRAIDFLAEQPEWDGRTLVVYGASQGGTQSIVAAALDPRVSFFGAGVPGMCDLTGALVGRQPGWPWFIPKKGEEQTRAQIQEATRYYDMVNFTPRIKAPGFFTVGFIDPTCPPSSVYAAYNQLQGKKEIFNDIHHGHGFWPEAEQRMEDAIAQHLASQQKP